MVRLLADHYFLHFMNRKPSVLWDFRNGGVNTLLISTDHRQRLHHDTISSENMKNADLDLSAQTMGVTQPQTVASTWERWHLSGFGGGMFKQASLCTGGWVVLSLVRLGPRVLNID